MSCRKLLAQLAARAGSIPCVIKWSQIVVFALLVLVLGVGIETRSHLSTAITMCSKAIGTGSLDQYESRVVALQLERDAVHKELEALKESEATCKGKAHTTQRELTAASHKLAESAQAHTSCVSDAEDALQRSDGALSETRHELQELREQLLGVQAGEKRLAATAEQLKAKLDAERLRCQSDASSGREGAHSREMQALHAKMHDMRKEQSKRDAEVSSLKAALVHAQRKAEEVERARKAEREGWRWRLLHEAHGHAEPAKQHKTDKRREAIRLLSVKVQEQEREITNLERKLHRRAARHEAPRGGAPGRGYFWPSSWWGDFGTDLDHIFGRCPSRNGGR